MTVSQAVKIINITQPLLHDAPSIIAERGFHRSVTPGQVAIEVGVVFFFCGCVISNSWKTTSQGSCKEDSTGGSCTLCTESNSPTAGSWPISPRDVASHVSWTTQMPTQIVHFKTKCAQSPGSHMSTALIHGQGTRCASPKCVVGMASHTTRTSKHPHGADRGGRGHVAGAASLPHAARTG